MSINEKIFTDKSIHSLSGRLKKTLIQSIGVFIALFYTGCLEIPPKPEDSLKVKTIGLWLIKDNESDSLYFKSNFDKPFYLRAFADPYLYTEQLEFYWYRDGRLLKKSVTFVVDTPFIDIDVPNRLKAVDSKNNTLVYDFKVYLNHPPELNTKTAPSDQDTVYASLSSALTFSWSSNDKDHDDSLSHYIKIDETTYYTGVLTSIQQSGFSPGKHSFSIWVIDSFGDADTLESKTFIVRDTTGAAK